MITVRRASPFALLLALIVSTLVGSASSAAPIGVPVTPTEGGQVVGWGYPESGETTAPSYASSYNVVAVSAGLRFSLALTADGFVFGFGDNTYGQLLPRAGTGVKAIAAGVTHALAITSSNTVAAWGNNDDGQTNVPASLNGKTVTAIAAGRPFSMALTSDGTVTTWGYDGLRDYSTPASLNGKTVTAIAASYSHALALTSDGKVTAWGSNTQGQNDVPAELADQTVTAIAAGTYTSMALTSAGKVVVWGTNDYRQREVPSSLTGKTVTSIASGWDALGALTSDGKVVMWGDPMPGGHVTDGRHVSAFAVGVDHVLAVVRGMHSLSPPTLGTAQVGTAISAHHGHWTDPATSYAYAWKVDGQAVHHGDTFTPTAAQHGKQLTLTVSATSSTGTGHATSAPVTIQKGDFTAVPRPVITGRREAGRILTASLSGVDPAPDSVTWVWKRSDRSGEVVLGSSATYHPTELDARKSVSAYATVHKAGYNSVTVGTASGLIAGCTTYC